MRYRGAQICRWTHGSLSGSLYGRITLVRSYSAPHQPGSPRPPAPAPPVDPAPPDGKSGGEVVKERALAALQHAGELGQQWGRRSSQAASATINYWWQRYEEFVGINEVRVAQTNVTEAEAAFMVARGVVREAHGGMEALQVRLKEVRDRLDRVSREEAHYLELATLEHKLLQEERRHRTAYENAETSEREKFALFSAAVRESHEKERTRAERTKNWSVIGSVLGALIGVMGSTYINRVRLQELKNLLLAAQKGPESLQEALTVQAGNHKSQRDELQALIDGLRVALGDAFVAKAVAVDPASPVMPPSAVKGLHTSCQKIHALLETLPPQLGRLEQGLGRVEGELSTVKKLLDSTPPAGELLPSTGPERGEPWEESEVAAVRRIEETQRTLGEQMRTNAVFSAVFAYSAAAIAASAVYLMLRGGG